MGQCDSSETKASQNHRAGRPLLLVYSTTYPKKILLADSTVDKVQQSQ